MTAFYVIKKVDGRIILNEVPPTGEEELVNVVNGTDWVDARTKLCIGGIELYKHRYGYGYFDE
jgi:hypothetical protein